jgi:hypothetical protein
METQPLMWAIDNDTPFTAGSTWGRDKHGVHEWIVAVKGTFDIHRDGSVTLANEQVETLLLPEYNGDPGASSLRYDADLVSPKPTTDILLNGTAYAPNGRPATEFLVSLRLGKIHKVLKVVGDRIWKPYWSSSSPEPVTKVPIVYERAFGGFDQSHPDPKRQRMDTRNPIGRGLVAEEGMLLPNFEYPSGRVDQAGPAGFGALPSHWSPRRELNGTFDEAWRSGRYPLLPADWDPRSLLCSPPDQRPERHLRGGELVELRNLTPDGALSFALPKVYLRFRTRIDGRLKEHPSYLATVIIEPDHLRIILVWQSALAVRSDGDYLDETIVSEKLQI